MYNTPTAGNSGMAHGLLVFEDVVFNKIVKAESEKLKKSRNETYKMLHYGSQISCCKNKR